MSQKFTPIPEIQEITLPLALRDSGDISRFNAAAESNLADMRQLALDWNEKVVGPLNTVGEQVNTIYPMLDEVGEVARSISGINVIAPHVDSVDVVAGGNRHIHVGVAT